MTDQRFTELLGKTLAAEISTEEHKEFMLLLSENLAYKQEYESLIKYFDQDNEAEQAPIALFERISAQIKVPEQAPSNKTDQAAAIESLFPEENQRVALPTGAKKRSFYIFKIAAVLAFCICTGLAYQFFIQNVGNPPKKPVWHIVSTPSSKKTKVKLPDGTLVTLNSESTLQYQQGFNLQHRIVYLNGEAFFEVAKNSAYPFIVETEKIDITVLGTAFNVKAYKNDPAIETTLLRGAIQLQLNSNPTKKILLKPKQKFSLPNINNVTQDYHISKLDLLTPGDTTNTAFTETSWMGSKLIFKNEPFDVLANNISRRYGMKLIFQKESLKTYTFTGSFEKENISEALKALQLIEPFHFKIADKTIYIY